MKKALLILFAFVLCSFTTSYSQEDHDLSELDSSVPDLFSFHEVVYPLWHTAYPNKDYKLFKELLPDVKEGAEKIYKVKMTGILRDKEDEWNKGVEKLHASVDAFDKACEANDEPAMLTTAEKLHTNFEMLVRIVKPLTKEVDEFHKVLYMIYHHYGPNKNNEELNKAIDDLMKRADEMKNAALPKWSEEKKEKFTKAAGKVYDSTKELKAVKDSNADAKQIETAIDKLHTDYMNLESVFD